MVSVLTLSAVDRGLEHQSGQIKDYKILSQVTDKLYHIMLYTSP